MTYSFKDTKDEERSKVRRYHEINKEYEEISNAMALLDRRIPGCCDRALIRATIDLMAKEIAEVAHFLEHPRMVVPYWAKLGGLI